MRVTPLAIAALLSLSSIASAQEGTPPEGTTPGGTEERGRGERGERGRFQRGMLPVDRLKEQLGLTDEQVQKLEAINQGVRERMEAIRKQFQDGTFDPQQMRDAMRNGRQEIETKIGEILTPEQQAKWKELREQQGDRFGAGRFGRDRGRDREALGRRLRDEALKELALSEEAAAVVTPLLDTVLETRRLITSEQERRRDEFVKQVRDVTEPEALQKLMTDYRDARKADQQQLKAAQDQLREVLTLDQEAKLVGMNILD